MEDLGLINIFINCSSMIIQLLSVIFCCIYIYSRVVSNIRSDNWTWYWVTWWRSWWCSCSIYSFFTGEIIDFVKTYKSHDNIETCELAAICNFWNLRCSFSNNTCFHARDQRLDFIWDDSSDESQVVIFWIMQIEIYCRKTTPRIDWSIWSSMEK